MGKALLIPAALNELPHVFQVYSDFTEDQTDLFWIDTVTNSGSVAMGDAVGGQAVLTPSDCSVVDNDEVYLACPNEIFLVANGKPLYGEARIKFSEVSATKLNYAFMFQNAVAADSILDDGAGLKVTGSTLGIYKVDGEAVLRVVSSINGTATVTVTTFTPTAGTYYTYGIEVQDGPTSTVARVIFTVNGQRLKDSNGIDIVHEIAYASATEMQVAIGGKLGASTNNDTVTADYIFACQQR